MAEADRMISSWHCMDRRQFPRRMAALFVFLIAVLPILLFLGLIAVLIIALNGW